MAADDGPRGDVVDHTGRRLDDGALANGHAAKHGHARAEPDVVPDGDRQEIVVRVVGQSFAMVPMILGDDEAILAAVEVVADA